MMLAVVACFLAISAVGNACSCGASHPQEAFCREDVFVAIVRIRSKADVTDHDANPREGENPAGLLTVVKKKLGRNEEERTPSNEAIDDEATERRRFRMIYHRYRARIKKAYKGINTTLSRSHDFYIYTPSSGSMCGKKLSVKGTYLIIGNIMDGSLRVNFCDYVLHWSSLPKAEKRNIRKNMMLIDCESGCQANSCFPSECEENSPNECAWNSKMKQRYGELSGGPIKFQFANFLCVPGTERDCEWSGGEITKTKKRAKRRRRRRRRGHNRKRHRPGHHDS